MIESMQINVSVIVFQEPISNPLEDVFPDIAVMTLWMTLMSYSVLLLTGNFIKFPLIERVSKAKQLQLMTGVSPLAYWFTCFICDFLYYIIVASIMVVGIYAADPLNVFSGSEELGMYV
jgi:Ni,Fe-hydrogenase I cytochrome b subunit